MRAYISMSRIVKFLSHDRLLPVASHNSSQGVFLL